MVTRIIAIQNLNKHLDKDLSTLALSNKITTYINGRQNKGWKGQTLELLAGLTTNNQRAPNGLDFELKSVAYYKVKNVWEPKETMAITMINPIELKDTSFFESHCWSKLKSLVFCACTWNGKHNIKSELLKVSSFDFVQSSSLIKEVEQDYEFIRTKLITTGFTSLTGKDGKWIQARTKGAGHGSTSRAFYARKNLIKEIIQL